MNRENDRRDFLKTAAGIVTAAGLSGRLAAAEKRPLFKVSLAEYSLHRMIAAKKLDTLDLGRYSMKEFGIKGLDRWNRPFFGKAKDTAYLKEMKRRDTEAGAKNLLIMIDGEGALGDPDTAKRSRTVENHRKWVEAAKLIGCHCIRVNAASKGSYEEQLKLAADGLSKLCEFAKTIKMSVIVENHGGLSSNGKWLAALMKKVDMPNCGTLPDFGNFHDYDRYLGVTEMMPWAKSVSAKSHDFDAEGNETHTDYVKMMKIVIDSGYRGWVGIEYEGSKISEYDGIVATKKLLLKVRDKLSA
ncbi:xylose isomerase [candidate division BRC1 bacterium SM23_51]|nr:MAG: xylose isomerase [candidate division BRC1 bacterium SM23_51]